MPRTYYEYLAAQDKWRIEHELRIASFPYPPRNSIVYTRQSTNTFWEDRRTQAAQNLPFETLQFTAADTFDFIRNVAIQEERKEQEFLAKFYPQSELQPGQSSIDKFNELFQGRERYERLLKRIKAARTKAENGWKGMAPNLDTLYASYLNQRLTNVLQEFRTTFTATTDFNILEERFREIIDKAIIDATNDLAAINIEDKVYGGGKDWVEISQIINSDPYLRSQFINNMRAAIGHENIQAVLEAMYQQKNKNTKSERTSTILRKNLKLSQRTASIGGNVIENSMAALAKYLGQLRGNNGSINYQVSGAAISGEMVTTDAILMFSSSIEVDPQQAVEKLNQMLSETTGTLDNAYNSMEKFYTEQSKAMDELYAVFINSKNYQLGGSYGVYSQPRKGALNELDDFLERAGISVGNIDDFLLTAYNTAKDAIYHDRKSEVDEGAVNALKAAAVKFMFDDWQTIGNNSGHGIHMFLLSGKYVPSSVIFYAMAKAGESSVTSKAKIYIPEINDPGPDSWSGSNDLEVKNKIYDYWQEEYDRISKNARWTADFVINVKKSIDLKI